jgi:hypothetical protein
MSAYDKDFSDAIYGIERTLRNWKSSQRMITMERAEERLSRENILIKCF